MANRGEHVDRGRRGAQLRQVVCNRPGRAAVLTDEDGGDALRHLAGCRRLGEQALGGVVVRIDEARGQHQPARVHHAIPLSRRHRPHLDDTAIHHAHRRRSHGRSGAIRQPCVRHDERGRFRRLTAIRRSPCLPVVSGRLPSRHARHRRPAGCRPLHHRQDEARRMRRVVQDRLLAPGAPRGPRRTRRRCSGCDRSAGSCCWRPRGGCDGRPGTGWSSRRGRS